MTTDTACLLLHGFGGSPFEMEPLVPALQSLGCTVDLPVLPGHDSTVEAFRKTFFKDWLACAQERFLALARQHEKVIPVGFSMGGSLALFLAARHSPAGVVAISAPLDPLPWLPLSRKSLQRLALPLLQHIRPVIPRRRATPESRAIAPYRGYEGASYLPQLYSMLNGLKKLPEELPHINCPALIMHDVRDSTSPPVSALRIAAAVASKNLRLRYTRIGESITSHHMLTTHQETRAVVIEELRIFVAALTKKGSSGGPGG